MFKTIVCFLFGKMFVACIVYSMFLNESNKYHLKSFLFCTYPCLHYL